MAFTCGVTNRYNCKCIYACKIIFSNTFHQLYWPGSFASAIRQARSDDFWSQLFGAQLLERETSSGLTRLKPPDASALCRCADSCKRVHSLSLIIDCKPCAASINQSALYLHTRTIVLDFSLPFHVISSSW